MVGVQECAHDALARQYWPAACAFLSGGATASAEPRFRSALQALEEAQHPFADTMVGKANIHDVSLRFRQQRLVAAEISLVEIKDPVPAEDRLFNAETELQLPQAQLRVVIDVAAYLIPIHSPAIREVAAARNNLTLVAEQADPEPALSGSLGYHDG